MPAEGKKRSTAWRDNGGRQQVRPAIARLLQGGPMV
jgi:hypothetical protein